VFGLMPAAEERMRYSVLLIILLGVVACDENQQAKQPVSRNPPNDNTLAKEPVEVGICAAFDYWQKFDQNRKKEDWSDRHCHFQNGLTFPPEGRIICHDDNLNPADDGHNVCVTSAGVADNCDKAQNTVQPGDLGYKSTQNSQVAFCKKGSCPEFLCDKYSQLLGKPRKPDQRKEIKCGDTTVVTAVCDGQTQPANP
jgi:hypothetical protein